MEKINDFWIKNTHGTQQLNISVMNCCCSSIYLVLCRSTNRGQILYLSWCAHLCHAHTDGATIRMNTVLVTADILMVWSNLFGAPWCYLTKHSSWPIMLHVCCSLLPSHTLLNLRIISYDVFKLPPKRLNLHLNSMPTHWWNINYQHYSNLSEATTTISKDHHHLVSHICQFINICVI